MRFPLSLVLVLVTAASAHAQIGNYILNPNGGLANLQRPFTVLDISSPATSSSTITTVAVRAAQNCTQAFKVKFFHQSGGTYTPFAERGPFDITHPLILVQMEPPVSVVAGDLIGLVALQDCTRLVGQIPLLFKNALQFNGEITSPMSLGNAASIAPNFALAAYGAPSVQAQVRTQIIVGAGSAQGAFGSSFKTDLFITNTRSMRSAGVLVYHPEGTSGTAADPAFPFIVDPHASVTYPDFVQNRLGLTGKGSIDVYTTIGNEPPDIAVRIYEDGAGGTKGFTLEAESEPAALQALTLDSGVLVVPSDASKYRMNIGLRTLNEETVLQFQLYDSAGGARVFVSKTYPANYYIQTDFQSLLGVTFQPGDSILVFPSRGAAYVYGSIIDNNSNDPSTQMATPLE